jgi:ribosomal protein S18 acetylase RimI-like enzyme
VDLLIRQATASDAGRIHEIHGASVQALCSDSYGPGVIQGWLHGRTPAGYLRGISNGATFVAELGARTVGFCEAVPGEILALFVDPQWTGRGIGAALLSHAMGRAAIDAQRVRLESTLNAVGFYEKLGFCQISPSIVRRNDVDVPVVIMEKTAG